MHDNLRGMALMTGAMAAFALADALIKALGDTHPSGQIIWVAGIGGTLAFALACIALREAPLTRDALAPATLARVLTEAVGTFGIVTALTLAPLSVVVAIMQSVPLLVTLGAAAFLGEQVGWRRWLAIIVGLLGVMIIIRPGTEGFTPPALFAVLAAVTLAARDILTRMVPRTATNLQLGVWGFAGLIPTGFLLVAISGQAEGPYTPIALTYFAGITVLTALAILFVTMSMRVGDVAVIAPFRYTRLLFGLALAILWFGERPDLATWIGSAIVVASGLYTFARERRLAQGTA
ncbi:DMT family transporter [Ovoidimarina sediminis]|uniref:DMT family transporter n=1 Tax=Ovoidimarina sediminis TaxID=3079856 RepID=UPI00291448C9|nr:DMT family transporter [Rhodophyticola sp. MJ-SS7]MDU8945674.1 DMT family transporter [Rhodophyticola sp. MJ-SS7]